MQQNSHTSKHKKTRILIRDPLPALRQQTQKKKKKTLPCLIFFFPLSLSLPSSSWETFFLYQICKPNCTSPITTTTTTTTRTTYKTLFFPLSLSPSPSLPLEKLSSLPNLQTKLHLCHHHHHEDYLQNSFFSLFFISRSPPLPLEKLFSLPSLQTKLHHHDNNEDNLQYGDHTTQVTQQQKRHPSISRLLHHQSYLLSSQLIIINASTSSSRHQSSILVIKSSSRLHYVLFCVEN